MQEVWKDISDFEGLYQVSNLGRVKSFRRSTKHRWESEYILKPSLANNGYYQVTLYDNTHKRKFSVHRLVATAFIPNPDNLPMVNHKDENRLNNEVSNLEWCTARYNNLYGTALIRSIETNSRPVEQLTQDGRVIASYCSAKVASALLGIHVDTIQKSCRRGTVGKGFYWRYKD